MSAEPIYKPRLVSEVVRLHIDYYAREWGFGLPFEAKVASELSAFLTSFRPNLDFMVNRWQADRLVGTVSLEGPTEADRLAHLRWFIVDRVNAGKGLGRALISQTISHARERGFPGIYLTTFVGLEPARRLYESNGFTMVDEADEDQWSGGVREQRFELIF